jgi:pyruvyltransferase
MNPVKAYWHQHDNFGDSLTRYWIERLTGREVQWTPANKADLIGCGSIVEAIPEGFTGIILGSGVMYETALRFDLKSADIRALRGPLTAERIGVDVPYGDMGLLFSLFKSRWVPVYEVGTLPHYAVRDRQELDHHYIDIMAGVESVVRHVSKCKRIISSSLHGIILADALGIENQWVYSDKVLGGGFKFRDYAASLGEDIEPGVWRLGNQERIADIAEWLKEIVIKSCT